MARRESTLGANASSQRAGALELAELKQRLEVLYEENRCSPSSSAGRREARPLPRGEIGAHARAHGAGEAAEHDAQELADADRRLATANGATTRCPSCNAAPPSSRPRRSNASGDGDRRAPRVERRRPASVSDHATLNELNERALERHASQKGCAREGGRARHQRAEASEAQLKASAEREHALSEHLRQQQAEPRRAPRRSGSSRSADRRRGARARVRREPPARAVAARRGGGGASDGARGSAAGGADGDRGETACRSATSARGAAARRAGEARQRGADRAARGRAPPVEQQCRRPQPPPHAVPGPEKLDPRSASRSAPRSP